MTGGTYGEGTAINSNADRFNESATYDKNGNIVTLQRRGQTGTSAYAQLDNLTYTYNGNQVTKIEDAVSTAAHSGNTAFTNGLSSSNEYTYDANGNITKDLNKGIGNIKYNLLNLPEEVAFTNGNSIKFFYSAEGEKLKVEYVIGGTTTNTCYCANVVYENNNQKYLLNDEGYYDLGGINGGYHYYLKDHLGNNRVVINQSGAVQQTNNYYPYGGTFASSTTGTDNHPYKYNGKEYDTHASLNWYDYGARHYDPAIARWMAQDPLAEKYYCESQYIFNGNNPIVNIDVDGKDYDVYFFRNEQKIVIRAIYYTSKGAENSAKEAIAFYNRYKGLQYEYEGEKYDVLFNLELKLDSSPEKTVKGLKHESNTNSYDIGKPKTNNSKEGVLTTGSTEDKKFIIILDDYKEGYLTGAHEIGHTLHLTPEGTHSPEGVMKQGDKDTRKDGVITQDNVNHMINSSKNKWIFSKLKK